MLFSSYLAAQINSVFNVLRLKLYILLLLIHLDIKLFYLLVDLDFTCHYFSKFDFNIAYVLIFDLTN